MGAVHDSEARASSIDVAWFVAAILWLCWLFAGLGIATVYDALVYAFVDVPGDLLTGNGLPPFVRSLYDAERLASNEHRIAWSLMAIAAATNVSVGLRLVPARLAARLGRGWRAVLLGVLLICTRAVIMVPPTALLEEISQWLLLVALMVLFLSRPSELEH